MLFEKEFFVNIGKKVDNSKFKNGWASVLTIGFNPRARVGRDLYRARDVPSLKVSIHAPAWGATYTELGTSLA